VGDSTRKTGLRELVETGILTEFTESLDFSGETVNRTYRRKTYRLYSKFLENLQTLVAGNIQAVSGDDWLFYLNEEGKIRNLALTAALLVLEETGVLADVYCGNAVFLGDTDGGDEADVPEELIDLAQQLFGLPQPVN
jgi:hypothetical protein